MFTVSRLVRIYQVVRYKVIRETRFNDTFYYFWYKREVGNWAVVREFIFVQGRFLEERWYDIFFESVVKVGESEWCILLWCLAGQTVAARHLSSCWRLLLSSASRVHKSTELLRHKTPDFTPDVASQQTKPQFCRLDYRLLTVIQECTYQKQQGCRTSLMSCGH